MKKVRVGCMEITFAPNGKPVNFRLTLPVPVEFIEQNGMADMLIKPNGKGTLRYFYCPESDVFEHVEHKKIAAQLLVNGIKMSKLDRRGAYLLSQLSSHII